MKMATKKIFISYDYENDRHYKNLLLAWDANREFDFYLNDQSVDVSVDSTNAAAIKRVISAKINESTYFLCLIGKKTHDSNWVAWEINKAIELNKKLIAVKIDNENISPSEILGVNASWAMTYTFESIKKAIENAR